MNRVTVLDVSEPFIQRAKYIRDLVAADEGCTLFVAESKATTAGTGEEAECTLEDPNECKDGKG
jgi:hypothetical protein